MHAKNFQDLTGKYFGYYKVIKEAEQHIQPNGNIVTMWICQCVCGTIKTVAGNHLKSRPNISCGCMKKTTLEDMTGWIFDNYMVESRAPSILKGNNKYRTMWNCKCVCGKTFIASASEIKSDKRKSCGCMISKIRSKQRLDDLTNIKYGRLTVKNRADDYVRPSGNKETMWNCICDCGKECVKSGQYLKKSPCPSCGCWKNELTHDRHFMDLTGEIINNLRVVEYLGVTKTKQSQYSEFLCECLLCNRYCVKKTGELLSGNAKSCGCLNQSKGERITKGYLNKLNISFIQEYTFNDLKSENNYPLFFDFALFNKNNELKCLIEYQGLQHYVDTDFGRYQREVTDKQKKEYCFAHNIPLCEIKYCDDINKKVEEIIATYVNSVPSSSNGEGVTTIP